MKRVLLIANKNWEVEPILNALLNSRIRPVELPNPGKINYPWTFSAGTAKPRAIWNTFTGVSIELWCVQDIMDSNWNPSSSQGKNECLPRVINYRKKKPDLVIALGTAGYGSETLNNNGCVVMGSNIFIHNFHPNGENPNSVWDDPVSFEKLLPSAINSSFFTLLDPATINSIEQRLLKPFLNPSAVIQVLSDKDFLGLSTVNITDYHDYATADQIGMEIIKNGGITNTIGSAETTHGVIRLQSNAPFVFISGITDRSGHFDEDVNGKDSKGNTKTEAQNFTAAYNIGICLAWLMPKIAGFIITKRTKK